jgi:CTP:molybdopterin cytidylyltransferase MocA
MVVLGADGEKISELTGKFPVRYCFNDNYREGMLSSVICGFRNIPTDYKAVLVFQGDQPLISADSINSIINAYLSSDKGIVRPVHDNKGGHPLLIDRKYHDEIENLDPSKGLRSLTEKFSSDVLEVEIIDAGILKDFDTYEDYLEQINKIQ